jgi:cation transporter-like permease
MPSIPPSLQLIFAVSAILSGICLLFGGLSFRKRQEHGRRLLLAAVWIGVGYIVVFSIGTAITMYTASGPPLVMLGMASVAIVAATFWALLMRRPIRYFGSTEVRCAVEGGHEAA